MFFGHISNFNPKQYPPAIQLALDYLQKTDFDQLEAGRYPLKGETIYVQVLDLSTQPKNEILPEVHQRTLDVQYLHSGKELIGYAPDLGKNTVATAYNPERDILFYTDAADEVMLPMQAGSFAVFFPEDVHRPACIDGKFCPIRKVVVKIAMSEI